MLTTRTREDNLCLIVGVRLLTALAIIGAHSMRDSMVATVELHMLYFQHRLDVQQTLLFV